MPEDDETTNADVEVREVGGGRRLFKAQRLSSGNWLLIESHNASRRTVNHEEFTGSYERVRNDDR